MNARFQPIFVLAIGLLAVSSSSTLIRLAQAEGAPSLVIAAFRVSIAAIATGLVVLFQGSWKAYNTDRRTIGLMVLSGMFLAGHFASWITSLELTSVANSVVLVTTTPIWVGLLAPIILKESTPKLTWVAIVLVIAGGLVISLAQTGTQPTTASASLLGDGLALIGALAGACYFMIGRLVRGTLSLLPYLFGVYGTAGLILFAVSAVLGLPTVALPRNALLWMLAVGLLPQLIGHSAINYAMRRISASFVAVTIIGEAIFSIVFAAIFLNELPLLIQIIGAFVVMVGILVASLAEKFEGTQTDDAALLERDGSD